MHQPCDSAQFNFHAIVEISLRTIAHLPQCHRRTGRRFGFNQSVLFQRPIAAIGQQSGQHVNDLIGTKQPVDVASSVVQAADDLMAQSKTNRDLLVGLIRTEVDKAIGRVGFVREDELAALRARVEKVEADCAAAGADESKGHASAPVESESPVKKKKKVVIEHES